MSTNPIDPGGLPSSADFSALPPVGPASELPVPAPTRSTVSPRESMPASRGGGGDSLATTPSHSSSSSSSDKLKEKEAKRIPPIEVTTSGVSLEQLSPHISRAPTFFYLLTFADPLPSPFTHPKRFLAHPYVLYFIGLIAALVAGVGMVSLDLVYGIFWSKTITSPDATPGFIVSRSDASAGIISLVGIAMCLGTWLFLTCFSAASHLLSMRLQHAYVASTMTQDASYFDLHGAGEIATRAGKDINTIRVAFGEKLGYMFWSGSTLVAAITSAFVNAPRYAGVLITTIPFLVIVFSGLAIISERVGSPALRVEGLAGSLIEQILSSVRVVQSFGMEKTLLGRLDGDVLNRLEKLGMNRAAVRAGEMSAIYGVLFSVYSLGFHWGSIQVADYGTQVGSILTAFWNMFNSLFALANVVPHIGGIVSGHIALATLRAAIERQPCIDIRSREGDRLARDEIRAPDVELREVTFAYPSRPGVASLKGVSLHCQGGKVTALVGPSGSGKSTIASLLLREYDPYQVPNPADVELAKMLQQGDKDEEESEDGKDKQAQKKKSLLEKLHLKKSPVAEKPSKDLRDSDAESVVKKSSALEEAERIEGSGQVIFAGRDIREYNLSWLRSQVSVVQQHPAIFTATVFENVAAGLTGTNLAYRPDVDGAPDASTEVKARTELIRATVIEALKKAQAWDFVQKLPDGMDTMVTGGRTGVLSGGQRQRLAIARALIRQPLALILDEATSALDSATEEQIRRMLEKEQRERGMTTIIIAHRLSTVRNADKLVVMRSGRVVDSGTHDELMSKDRNDHTYRNMVLQQRSMLQTEPEDEGKDSELMSDVATTKVASPRETHPLRPVPLAQRPSRTQEHGWPVHGRNTTISQLEHNAESQANEADASTQAADAISLAATSDAGPTPANSLPSISWGKILGSFIRYIHMYRWWFIIGSLGAIAAGSFFPLAGWMLGQAVGTLSIPNNPSAVRSETDRWALYFFILAIASVFITFINAFSLETGSERIVRTLKYRGLSSLIRQEIGFFDAEDQAAGGLTAAVANHPSAVGAATGTILSQLIIALVNLLGSVILAFVLDWRVALVCLSPIVLMFVSGYLNVAMLESFEKRAQKPMDKAASYVAENLDSVKTVAALGREAETLRLFDVRARADKTRIRYLLVGALGFAISQALVLWVSALVFYYAGAKLFSQGQLSLSNLYSIFEAIIIGTFSASRMFTFVPDWARAAASMRVLTSWIARKPRIAALQGSAGQIDAIECLSGDIVFSDVEMRYPTRPRHPALNGLEITLKAGQRTAICGTSGSGKSSTLALLQRFYDPSRGTITFGGVDARSISLDEVRAKTAYVSQDPVLFSGTIFWNLTMGAVDPSSVTREQVEAACEQACILDFIRGLPKGFETEIGFKGAQLSGGQKQRLCIARALLRQPLILLLDEATSALDAESEVAVQAALDRASKGRTTVIIAHRLSTIRNSETIHVIEDGLCIESGTHDSLIRKRGRYLELVEAQL